MSSISRNDGSIAPLTVNEAPAALSEKEIAEVQQKFWATDVIEKSPALKADQMAKLYPARPVLLQPGAEEALPQAFTLKYPEISEPDLTDSDVPDLISGEQNSWIASLGAGKGMNEEQILQMRFFNDHRAEADPATLEFLASVDDTAFNALKKDFPKIVKDPKAQMRQNRTDEANSELYLKNFKGLIKHLPKDEQTAYLFAFSYEEEATPEMQAKVKPVKAEALAKTQKEAGIPAQFSPPLNTAQASDAITFEYKLAYENELNNSGLSEDDKARAKFANFHSDFIEKIEPQERGAYLSVKKVNDQIGAKIKQDMVTRFSLPATFNPLDDPLAKSSYNANLNGEYVHQMLKEVSTFGENSGLNRRQLRDIEYSMLRPNNPFADPEMQKIAAVLTSKMLPKIREKYLLPSNFIPPIEQLNVLTAGSSAAVYLHKLVASASSDAETATAMAEEEADTPEGSDFMNNMKKVTDALGLLQSSIYSWQADESQLTMEFTLANMEAQIDLLETQRKQIEEIRAANEKMAKQKKGKKTSEKILMVLNPVKTIVKLIVTNVPADCPIHVTAEEFDKHSSLTKIIEQHGPHVIMSKSDWNFYNKYISYDGLEKIVVEKAIAPAVDWLKGNFTPMKWIDWCVVKLVDEVFMPAIVTLCGAFGVELSERTLKIIKESLNIIVYAVIIAAACMVGGGVLAAGFFLPGMLMDTMALSGLDKQIQKAFKFDLAPQLVAMVGAMLLIGAAVVAKNPAAAKAAMTSMFSKKPPLAAADDALALTDDMAGAIELTTTPPKPAPTGAGAGAGAATTTGAASSGAAVTNVTAKTSRMSQALDGVQKACRREMDRVTEYFNKAMQFADDAANYSKGVKANAEWTAANAERVSKGLRPSTAKPFSDAQISQWKKGYDLYHPHLEKFLGPMFTLQNIGTIMENIQEAKNLKLRSELAGMMGDTEAFVKTLSALVSALSQAVQRMTTAQTAGGSEGQVAEGIQEILDQIYQGYGGAVAKVFR